MVTLQLVKKQLDDCYQVVYIGCPNELEKWLIS